MGALAEFQLAFGQHVRDPRTMARPAGVPARRMRIYEELLFNNLEGFLLACFPVLRDLLGRRWAPLVRAFFREARCQTPYFREIPREFVRWLGDGAAVQRGLPAWAAELAHYEWAELAVEVMDAVPVAVDADGDLLARAPVFAPLLNLAYAWPVQRIGRAWRPRKPQAVNLLVHRDVDDKVRFMQINPVTARLVALLQEGGRSGRDAIDLIGDELSHPDPVALRRFGGELLASLREAGVIRGVAR